MQYYMPSSWENDVHEILYTFADIPHPAHTNWNQLNLHSRQQTSFATPTNTSTTSSVSSNLPLSSSGLSNTCTANTCTANSTSPNLPSSSQPSTRPQQIHVPPVYNFREVINWHFPLLYSQSTINVRKGSNA